MKIYRRSASKMAKDMDILNFIKMQRRHSVSLYGLLTKNQKKFSEILSKEILSEFSSSDQSKEEKSNVFNENTTLTEPDEDE